MGKYVSWQDKEKRRQEWHNKHEEARKIYRESAETLSEWLIRKARSLVKNCGLSQIQISDFSGVGTSLVSRFLHRKISPKVHFGTIVSLLLAAGYRIKFERIPPEQDRFYKNRRLPPGSDY